MNLQQMPQSKLACQIDDVDGCFRGGFGRGEMNNFFLHHQAPPPLQLPSFSPTSGGGGSSSSGSGGYFFRSPQMGYRMMSNHVEQGNGWSFQTPNGGGYVGNQANGVVCMKQGGGGEKGEGSESFVVEKRDEHVQHTKLCSRGHWRPAEDARLKEIVSQYGPHNWNQIAQGLEGRSGKSCRLRWFNQLDPRINKRAFSEEEEERLLSAHRLYGSKWAMIARVFPGRTDNAVKNHWHVMMARRNRAEQSSTPNKRRKASVPPQAMMMMEMEMEINPTNSNALSADSTISSTIDESASTVTHDLSLNNSPHFAMFNNFSPSQHQSPLEIQMGGSSDQQKWVNGMMMNTQHFGSMGFEYQSVNVGTNLEVSATDSFGTTTSARNNFCKGSGDHEKINRPFIDFLGVGSA